MPVTVAISTVADGSMLNRSNKSDLEVIRNREALLQKYSLTPENTVRLRVHFETEDFCRYKLVSAKHSGQGMVDDNVVPADALITTEPNLALLLPVADCIGAVIYDETKSVLALAHLGRHSLEQYGGKKIIEHLVENFSVNIEDLHIWMTPAAGKEVYPIWKLDNKGMKEAAHEQFASAGIKQTQITDDATETTTSSDYFSYSDYLKGNRASDGDHAILAVMH